MRTWHVSWREVDEWTDEQFNALVHTARENARREREEHEAMDAMRDGKPKGVSPDAFLAMAMDAGRVEKIHVKE